MKQILTLLLSFLSIASFGQITMNIYQSSGAVVSIPVNTIDSITYTGTPLTNFLVTNSYSSLTPSTVFAEGAILYDPGTPITHHGFVFGYDSSLFLHPILGYDTIIVLGSPVYAPIYGYRNYGAGAVGPISGYLNLELDTTYYLRSFTISNSHADTTYGNVLIFNPPSTLATPGGGVTDIDGNTYSSVIIGTQEWMSENLRTGSYANGDVIPNVTDGTLWSGLTTGGWAHYDNNSALEVPQGKMYNWYAVDDVRNVCPTGWHVPVTVEWNELTDTGLGGSSVAGPKVRNISAWGPGVDATNESGFNAVPSGLRMGVNFYGLVPVLGFAADANWWSKTQSITFPGASEHLEVIGDLQSVQIIHATNEIGMAVRCLKD